MIKFRNNIIGNSSMNKENSSDIIEEKDLAVTTKESLKPFWDKKIAILVGDQEIRDTIVHDLKFFGLKKITIFRTRRELFSQLSTTDPQPDILFSDMDIIDSLKPSERGIYMLRTLQDFALEHNFNVDMDIILIARKIDKENTMACFKHGAKDILLFPSPIHAFGSKLLKWVKKITEKVESEIDAFLKRGDEFFRRGEFENAIKQYDIILKNYGEKADVLEKKGQALLAAGDYELAISSFKKSVQINSNFSRAFQGLGDSYIKLMDYDEARKNYRKVLGIEPDNYYVQFNIGETYRSESRWREAEFIYKDGIKKNPKFIFFRIGLAETYVKTRQIDKAIETYKDAIRLKPRTTQFSARLGDICVKNRMYSEAETILKRALQENEGAVILFNKLGIALRKQGKYKEAIAKYRQALKIDPHDPSLHYNMGKAYNENGDKEKAVESFLISIQIDPSLKETIFDDKEITSLHQKLASRTKLWINSGSGKSMGI